MHSVFLPQHHRDDRRTTNQGYRLVEKGHRHRTSKKTKAKNSNDDRCAADALRDVISTLRGAALRRVGA